VIQEEDIIKKPAQISPKSTRKSSKKQEINFEEVINSIEKDEFKISDLKEDKS